MQDALFHTLPQALEAIEQDTRQVGFSMPSERKTGSLLRVLAAAKPGGRLLELGTGTGTGLATAWLLAGMDPHARLDSVDNDPAVLNIARRHLDADQRVTFHGCDGAPFIAHAAPASYDLIFADAWPGKYAHLDEALNLLKTGGLYVIDDMTPQPTWPVGHNLNVERLLRELDERTKLAVCRLVWATGVVICTRTA